MGVAELIALQWMSRSFVYSSFTRNSLTPCTEMPRSSRPFHGGNLFSPSNTADPGPGSAPSGFRIDRTTGSYRGVSSFGIENRPNPKLTLWLRGLALGTALGLHDWREARCSVPCGAKPYYYWGGFIGSALLYRI